VPDRVARWASGGLRPVVRSSLPWPDLQYPRRTGFWGNRVAPAQSGPRPAVGAVLVLVG